LPINIDIPREGQVFQFSKLLVVEGESPWISVNYSLHFGKFRGLIKLAVTLVVVLIIVVIVKKLFFKNRS
jgi:hypothetical protein